MSQRLAIVIPIYKTSLTLLEQFSLDYLLGKAPTRTLVFIAPEGLDTSYYQTRYPAVGYEFFAAPYFESIAGYNALLLSTAFYERFTAYEFILIHQTDALLFKDNLDAWMDSGYDYIGAPWPMGMTLNFNPAHAAEFNGSTFHAFVGNGGFSLRSISKSIAILHKADSLLTFWKSNQLNEDCFFAFAALLTPHLRIPEPTVASRFALEIDAENYVNANQGEIPTGCHAWWKHDFPFWQRVISVVG